MNNENIKKLVKALAKVAYPDYSGRKFSACEKKTYNMNNFWDGGSRDYCVAVNLTTGKIVPPDPSSSTPWNKSANSSFDIPPGMGILEHSFFCVKDMGIILYVAPQLYVEAMDVRFMFLIEP